MRRRRFVQALVASVLALGVTAAAPASAGERISDAEFNAIVKVAWDTGKVSKQQRARILTRPDLAATTIDPTSAKADYELPGYVPDPMEVTRRPPAGGGGVKTQVAALALTTRTSSKDRYIVYENWVHTKIVDYHVVVGWSWNGRNVIGTPSAYTYTANAASGVQNLGIQSNDKYPNYNANGIYAWTMPIRAAWKRDADTHYPTVRFGVYFDGTYHYEVLSK